MGLCDYCHDSQMNYYCYEEKPHGQCEVHLCIDCFKKYGQNKFVKVIKC